MQLTKKALATVFALAAIFASTSVFASIPRSEILTSSAIDLRYELASPPPAPDDNAALLARALDDALPRPASLDRYAETRVGASDLLAPFEQQRASGLTRALRRASPFREFESASGKTFCGGDPINCSDPTGMTGESDLADVRRELAAKRAADAEDERRAYDAEMRAGGSIRAMKGSSWSGAFWYAVDTATLGFFSLPGGNYSPLNEDEPTQASLDLRTLKKEHPGTIFVADVAQALTPKGVALKAVGIIGAGLNLADNLNRTKPLKPGESGRFSELHDRRVTGDNLTPHHMPQRAAGFTSKEEGGALVMTHAEHELTRTYFSKGRAVARLEAGMAFRDVLARDIRDVRKIVGPKYNKGIQELLVYYRTYFPELIEVSKVAK